METPDINNLNKSTCTQRYIQKRYPEFTEYLLSTYPKSLSWPERLYWYKKGLKDWPVCPQCGKRVKFLNLTLGYQIFCSSKCSNTNKEKIKKSENTWIQKYGAVGMASKSAGQKAKETMMKKYGVDSVTKLESWQENAQRTRRENNKKRPKKIKVKENSPKLKFVVKPDIIHYSGSDMHSMISDLLSSHNISFTTHEASFLPYDYVDFYLSEHKIAIDICGVLDNSDKKVSKSYHMKKFEACQKAGIQLLTLWEDWIAGPQKDIVKSLVLNKCGVYKSRVYARQCEVREVSPAEANQFLDQNHIQGGSTSTCRLGLYYGGSLVSLMTFGGRRAGQGRKDDYSTELVRFCNLRGWQIVGGASRLLKHYIDSYHPSVIKSFSSNDISDGHLYSSLGFSTDNKHNESYWYIDPKTLRRFHRYSFSKDQIVRKGLAPSADKTGWTERQVMDSIGYIRIYDSGQTKWILSL